MSLYYQDTLHAHQHQPEVPPEYEYLKNERQWLLLHAGSKKIAFLRYYMIK